MPLRGSEHAAKARSSSEHPLWTPVSAAALMASAVRIRLVDVRANWNAADPDIATSAAAPESGIVSRTPTPDSVTPRAMRES
jgi:hypothetical protein